MKRFIQKLICTVGIGIVILYSLNRITSINLLYLIIGIIFLSACVIFELIYENRKGGPLYSQIIGILIYFISIFIIANKIIEVERIEKYLLLIPILILVISLGSDTYTLLKTSCNLKSRSGRQVLYSLIMSFILFFIGFYIYPFIINIVGKYLPGNVVVVHYSLLIEQLKYSIFLMSIPLFVVAVFNKENFYFIISVNFLLILFSATGFLYRMLSFKYILNYFSQDDTQIAVSPDNFLLFTISSFLIGFLVLYLIKKVFLRYKSTNIIEA
jgi:hypothetical protein